MTKTNPFTALQPTEVLIARRDGARATLARLNDLAVRGPQNVNERFEVQFSAERAARAYREIAEVEAVLIDRGVLVVEEPVEEFVAWGPPSRAAAAAARRRSS